jgi:ABC-type glycerol-3-phosphate transport system substrate-binding protein
MQVGLPYVQISDMSQVNAGVGALNIFPTLLMQNGISLYNEELTESTLMEPRTIETFVEWTNFYTKFGFPKTYDFYNRFRVGLMPMAVVSYTMYASLTAAAPEISRFWKMAPIPGVRQEDGSIDRTVSGGGTAAIILKDSDNPELAWKFIDWWTSTETQYTYAGEVENILGTAARHDTANVEALKRLSWDKENLEALLSQWENVKEIPEIPGGYYLSRVIDQVFWNTTNGEDPYEMMAKWGRIANKELERKGEQYGN